MITPENLTAAIFIFLAPFINESANKPLFSHKQEKYRAHEMNNRKKTEGRGEKREYDTVRNLYFKRALNDLIHRVYTEYTLHFTLLAPPRVSGGIERKELRTRRYFLD